MNEYEVKSIPGDQEQLKKYAEDLSAVYRSEKRKREELEAANEQLVEARNELLKREKALEESRECYRSLVENLPVGVFRFYLSDPEKLVYANSVLAKINDDAIDKLMSQPVSSFFPDKDELNMLVLNTINDGSIKNRPARLKRTDGKLIWCSISAICRYDKSGEPEWIQGIVEDVSEKIENEKKLQRINEEFNLLISSMASVIIGVSIKDRITHWNPYAEKILGIKPSDAIDKVFCECNIKWEWIRIYESISKCILEDRLIRLDDIKYEKPDGKPGILGLTVTPLKHESDILEGFLILGRDLTEQRFMEQQLMQGSKLEAIGQLSSGVAHEINTPLQYVGDNIRFITKSFAVLLSILDLYQRASANYNDLEFFLERIREIEEISEKEMFSFILKELPGAIDQSLEGVEKVSSIVQSMKAFSHPGIGRKVPADINRSIENTVTVSRNEWKYDCELKLDLDYNLPEIPCYESELNQVVLNLLVNAADAIHENIEKGHIKKGVIIINTSREEYYAVITVSDNGGGIPENIRDKIFNPFFTTKEVGKGTGQGLALSFSIIHEKHGGTLSYETKMGEGTTFIIKLPFEDD